MSREIYRAPWHDYQSPCIYMVTMNKAPGVRDFGSLAGDVKIPRGNPGSPFVSTSPTGDAIKSALRKFHEIEPATRIYQYAIMPDHLHLLLHIQYRTEATLGMTIARFKTAVNDFAGITHVFDKGFNDQILKPDRSLQTLYDYIRDNPRRLAERRANPDFFRRLNNLTIAGHPCQAYGNLQLIDNPFKQQVIVHRADTRQQRDFNRLNWLYTADNGGVLVSPFISPDERAIRDEADAINGQRPGRSHRKLASQKPKTGKPVKPAFNPTYSPPIPPYIIMYTAAYHNLINSLKNKKQIRVLFVCLGNICRSTAAEAVMLDVANKAGQSRRWVVDSAGTGNYHIGDLADPRMREHAGRRGIRLLHRARQVRVADFDDFDLIIPMDNSNLRNLRRLAPTVEAEAKLVQMAAFIPGGEFAPEVTPQQRLTDPLVGYDYVPDPYYEGADGFELVLDLLQAGCANLLHTLTP